jgi:hypothetical protein
MPDPGGMLGSSRAYVNGTLRSLKQLFDDHANRESKVVDKHDTETYTVKGSVYANSIDERTGKIVQSKVVGISRRAIEEEVLVVTLAN